MFADKVRERLEFPNPYEGFDYKKYPEDLLGPEENPAFKEIINALNVSLIVEVGTWKGNSAIHMASLLKAKGADAAIICVDTWLGSLEHLVSFKDHPKWSLQAHMLHGYPTLYYQFLANVMHRGCQDMIIPFPNTSRNAAKYLGLKGVHADLVYVDAGHDEDSVYEDICRYWNVLRARGVMLGDDWHPQWQGVINAVNRFSKEKNVPFHIHDSKWMMHKTVD